MEREQIRGGIVDILTSKDFSSLQIDASSIDDDTSLLNDIALDSIQILELIVAIENRFQIRINTKRLNIDVFDRFSDLVDFVDSNLKLS
ncbi:MAG TPA: acyl carrier protein [Blastocatellia bacterium]|jgi:acyl carrier protein|nr:acyl carrier protein [Blastocatellia bacterium]